MDKCNCFHVENRNRYTYHPITGCQIVHNIEVGVCWGTKEIEECFCGGDAAKCDFYQQKRSSVQPTKVKVNKANKE